MVLGLFSPKDLYNTALAVLLIEHLGHPALVGLAAVDRAASLVGIEAAPISKSIW